MSEAQFLPGNRITLLESGGEYFPELLKSIDSAEREIHLETYIFANDETGRTVAAALSRAAMRGVIVRLMVDGFGAREFPATLMPRLSAAGVQVLVFRQEVPSLRFRRHRLRRLHRKLAVIDGTVAFVGGINIIDDMDTPDQTPPRYDFAVRVEGPLLESIHRAVANLWERVSWASFKQRFRLRRIAPLDTRPRGTQNAAFIIRDNVRHRRDIENAYLSAIAGAHSEIIIANAYFLPGRRFRRAIVEAAARGVKVVILLQGRVEYRLLHYATRALYPHFLASGIRIFEYHRSFLHAKVAVIDHHWATVGSSNIDPFSLLLAREGNVVVRDKAFAVHLKTRLEAAMSGGATELARSEWERSPWLSRMLSWGAYGLVRLMIGIAGYARHHDSPPSPEIDDTAAR